MQKLISTILLASALSAQAEITALVAVEPTSKHAGLKVSRAVMQSGLGKAIDGSVTVTTSEDLADVMRATRSGGYDIFIAPAQVAASALQRGYELIGSTDEAEKYVLVGRSSMGSTASVRGKKIYLPQQDSIYTYMARGMLNASGLSFKDLKNVQYERYPQAGLTAVMLGLSDATVVLQRDWDEWSKTAGHVGKVLAASSPVPGGFSVVVRKDLSAEVRAKIATWFTTSAASAGMNPVWSRAALKDYKSVAELGLFTPVALPGAKVVTAAEAKALQASGAVLVDTRTDKEFKNKRIANAVYVPYVEKSLKDVVFDAKLDDFSAVDKLDKTKPTIFSCNGAECWKSYKASRVAIAKGFTDVYWFRGGLPEWEVAGLDTGHE